MFYRSLTYPGVFEVRENPKTKEYYLERKELNYKVPSKLYGGMDKYVEFYWNSFERMSYTGGLLLTGQKGSGKTVISATLCNRAIQHGMQVVEITNVSFSTNLLRFLDELDSVVLFFDEFGKNFSIQQQDKMLTVLSNISGKERVILITENEPRRVSEFIRNRPGRVKYSLHFNKLPIKVVEEYCSEKNVSGKFYKDFLDAYNSIITFQFDHLIAIVEEHLYNPDMEFEELIELLNIEDMSGKKVVVPFMAMDSETGDSYDILNSSPNSLPLDNLEKHGNLYLNVAKVMSKDEKANQHPGSFRSDSKNIILDKKCIKSTDEETITFEINKITVVCKIERQ